MKVRWVLMNDRKIEGLFVPNVKMPESCSDCPVKRYNINTGDIFCIPLNKVVGNCVFDNDNGYVGEYGYVGELCTKRHAECQLQEGWRVLK